jgi:transcriptional regulator with XRE-family HTH domain
MKARKKTVKTAKPKGAKDSKTSKASESVDRQLPNKLTKALGKALKHYRHEAGVSQMNLAFSAELERSYISRIERGVSNPTLMALATICHVLKITLPELFENIRETLPPTAEGGTPRRANQSVLEKAPPTPKRKMPLR